MFIRYLGGGIGHKATEHIQPNIYKRAHEKETVNGETQEECVAADHAADHTESLDECDERDSEGVVTDEELEGEYTGYEDSAIDSEDSDTDTDQQSADHDEETFEDYE